MRCFRLSGSKVITDPVELDPDLLQLLGERLLLLLLGHAGMVAGRLADAPRHQAARQSYAVAGAGTWPVNTAKLSVSAISSSDVA